MLDLLDSPGILPPRIDSEDSKLILVLIKALPAKHLFLSEIANFALSFLMKNYPENLKKQYEITFNNKDINEISLNEYFHNLANQYHFKALNNEYNLSRAMRLLIHDLQIGKLGAISFEKPE